MSEPHDHPAQPGPVDPGTSAPDAAAGFAIAAEDVADPEELDEVLTLARESGDGSLLMRTLVRSRLCVPLPSELAGDSPGRRTLEPGTELPMPLIENEGNSYVVAFTSEERMADWFAELGQPVWHEALLADLLPGWPESAGLALDASSEGGVLLPGAVIDRLKLLATGAPVEEAYDLGPATRFRAGTPVDPPEELLEALRGVATRTPSVQRVTLLLVQIDEPLGRTWPVVGVVFDEGSDPEGPLTAMVEAVEQVTDDHVSFTALPATEGSEFERVLRDDGLVVT